MKTTIPEIFSSLFKPFRRVPLVAAGVSCVIVGFFVVVTGSSSQLSDYKREFEVGRVADRDVIAERSVTYVDEEATRSRIEAQERLVPAVFKYSHEITRDVYASFSHFSSQVSTLFKHQVSLDTFRLTIQGEYPNMFSQETLEILFKNPSRERFLGYAESVLRTVMDNGVFAPIKISLDQYNPDFVEILRREGGRLQREQLQITRIVTMQTLKVRIQEIVSSGAYPTAFASIAPGILLPFIMENVFFSPEETRAKIEELRSRLEPVTKRIEEGEKIIRKGFIVSKEDLAKVQALEQSLNRPDPVHLIGQLGLLVLFTVGILLLYSPLVSGLSLGPRQIYLIATLTTLYILEALFIQRSSLQIGELPLSVVFPTALWIMLVSSLVGVRPALIMAFVNPFVLLATGYFDVGAFLFATLSGVASVFALQGAERRMDLIRASLIIAAVQATFLVFFLLYERAPLSSYGPVLFWGASNGMTCGMLLLGFLAPLEQLLNVATPFRLMELSDLNAPALKRLLTLAPGTYSHSVTVANLAESACRDIGANALLARVGAYYHDIGKMEQSEYFIENQNGYNKHDELEDPFLSATVIRSHVKQGVEKARALGLPQEVIDIIAEHHGNSVIAWFYNEALKKDDTAQVDDFSYPGNPPRSREAAVVMLADTVEAAVRTLKKPTMARLEKFIQELIMDKLEQGQLSHSELTFRDMEIIKNSFVKVLAGHYHARIEYPKALFKEVLP
ncbi:MAG TPA: HDIG domain-containing protein [Termitinemataceae bacterium]|nr:HDIG domain-containing protein [Termitinemataceae bacterium]HOM22718.1 HDIG domain-containing protein [Termitinemataceae bacterium]HPQ00834.1 HDIG domain-containing protein [Termitinemataceae bacterium]